jgi:hypothetical protein
LETLPTPIYETVVQTLIQIKELLDSATDITGNYGLRKLSEGWSPIEQNRSAAKAEIRRQATMVFKIRKSCSMFQKIRWVIYDRSKFDRFIESLTRFIDALYEFCPVDRRRQLSFPIQADALAMTIIDSGPNGVQLLQQAAQQANGASFREVSMIAASQHSARTVQGMEAGQYIHLQPAVALRLDVHQVEIFNNPDTPTNLTRSSGAFRFNVRSRVIIEWRTYSQRTLDQMSKEDLQRRIEALAMLLSPRGRPNTFRVLDCLGYFEDNTATRFGLVFRFPSTWDKPQALDPLTLYEIMTRKDKTPYLGERFELACYLAESAYEFLVAGWLHKSMNSHNILFFRETKRAIWDEPDGPVTLKDPYFAGFALARPDGSDSQTSRRVPISMATALYRHPDVMGLNGDPVARYHPLHDLYSLGAILLDIGTWLRLEKRYIPDSSPQTFMSQLLSAAVPQLGATMGEKYMQAVHKCLTGKFEGTSAFNGNEPDYHLNLQRSFYWEVVTVLRSCHV